MTSYQDLKDKPKRFESLTGHTLEEFSAPIPYFSKCFLQFVQTNTLDGEPRKKSIFHIIMKLHFVHFLISGLLVGIICILYGLDALLLMAVGAALYALFHDYSTWQLGKDLQEKIKSLEKEIESERHEKDE